MLIATEQEANSKVYLLGLSDKANELLWDKPELLKELEEDRNKEPLAGDYTPHCVEIFFDDLIHIRAINGRVTFTRKCDSNYQPKFIEWRFDDECVFFQVGHEVVVSRLSRMAAIDEVLGRLIAA